MVDKDMEIDQAFDYDLGNDDFLLIEQTEQMYLNSQQIPSTTPIIERNEPTGSMSWNPAQEAVGSVEWNVPQEIVDLTKEEIQIAQSNIDTANTTNSRFDPEAERLFENYRFQIERLQMNGNNNEIQQQHQAELLKLREQLKDKERELIHVKKELYKFKEKPSESQQKRSFPGFNIYDKPKTKIKRNSSKPSPFAHAAALFSQPRTNSQVTTTELESSIPSDKASVKMPRLASLASPMLSTASSNKQVVNVKSESEQKESSMTPDPPLTVDRPRKIHKLTESESKQKLLIVLLTPQFQKWNEKYHNNNRDINIALTRPLIKELGEEFSQQFVPEPNQHKADYERLQLLASDINNSLLKGESTYNTIRILLNILNLSLKIATKCKLYKIIYNIINVVNDLTVNFIIARKYLQRDVVFESNSLLIQFTKSLSLFPFYESPCPQLHVSREITFKEIDQISTKFNVKPLQIYKELQTEKVTGDSNVIIKSILELFIRIGSGCKESIFTFLLTNNNFLNLINPKRPFTIIYSAMTVLESSLTNESCLIDYNDNKLQVVHCLIDLINAYSKTIESIHWYKICIKSFALLELILTSDLPEKLSIEANKLILEKVNDTMDLMAARYVKNAGHLTNTIREQRDDFVKFGLQTIYSTIKWSPTNVFDTTEELKPSTVLQMVYFFQSNIQPNSSLSRTLNQLITLLAPPKQKARLKK